eukprot:COSAG02_NODE_2391_length_8978_cov_14.980403_10_plen_37_part_00
MYSEEVPNELLVRIHSNLAKLMVIVHVNCPEVAGYS